MLQGDRQVLWRKKTEKGKRVFEGQSVGCKNVRFEKRLKARKT